MTVYIVKAWFNEWGDGSWSKVLYSTLDEEEANYLVQLLSPVYKECQQLEEEVMDYVCHLYEVSDKIGIDTEWWENFEDRIYTFKDTLQPFRYFRAIQVEKLETGIFTPLL